METRNVTLTLDKAKEFYNSGNEALKEVALQAFTAEELKSVNFKEIKTFEDACKVLGIPQRFVECDINRLKQVESNLGNHLIAIYKLDIIRRALNGDWKPKMTEGNIYYSWVRFYLPDKSYYPDKKIIATLRINNQEYLLIGGYSNHGYYDGIGYFDSKYRAGSSYVNLGLFCCKSSEIAQYMSEQFGKIIFDACYAQHIGAYEWV